MTDKYIENYIENYRKIISSLTDEELAEKYLERANYTEEYNNLLIKEIEHREIPMEVLTSKETAMQFLIEKKSDEKLYDIYTDLDYDKEMQLLAKQEAERRGLNTDAWEKEKITALKEGEQGRYIVAGYILSIFGLGLVGLIGLFIALDYVFAKKNSTEGKFYKYNKATRSAGRGMLIVFAITVILLIMLLLN
ncbi:MAG: hypothetical protein LBE13_05520 [Bacteroidales bacterium]|jgi:hypothetical protein|nr:hypothetical protein [Bacteroidales bacterium]